MSFKKFLKHLSFLLIILIVEQHILAQELMINWQKAYGGERNEIAYASVETTDGGFMIVGSTSSKNSFDVKDSRGYEGAGGIDFWIIKTNSTGTIEWSKTFGGSKDDIATSIVKTTNNEYLIVGTTQSTDGDANPSGVNGGLILIRLKLNGDIVSKRLFVGGTRTNEPSFSSVNAFSKPTLKVLEDGRIVLGATRSIGIEPFSGLDFYLAMLTPFGDTLWEKTYGGGLEDYMNDIIICSDGGLLMVGSTFSSSRDISGAGNGFLDMFFVKADPSGKELWKKGIGGTGLDLVSSILEIGNTKEYLLVGESNSNNGAIGLGSGEKDGIILRIDNSGNVLALKQFGGVNNDGFYHISRGKDNLYYCVGTSESPQGNVKTKGPKTDVWMMVLEEKNLTGQYHKLFGGADIDLARHVTFTTKGELFLSASSRSSDLDLNTNRGQSDFWLVYLALPPPILFGRFDAFLNDTQDIELLWITTYENNAQLITLEKSSDNKTFFKLSEENALGISNDTRAYKFIDKKPFLGKNFYRIMYSDKSGKSYSGPIANFNFVPLAIEPLEIGIKVYPNPATDYLFIESDVDLNNITILNLNGRKIRTSAEYRVEGKNKIVILEKLPSGVYFVIMETNVSKHTKKIVIR